MTVAETPAEIPARIALALRADRVYLGWQYALVHPHPGPAPRRPTPPAREQLNPGWVAAQRREQRRLDRPLEVLGGAGVVLAAGLGTLGMLGLLNPGLTAVGMLAGLTGAVLAAREIRRSEHLMRTRVAGERSRVAKIAAHQFELLGRVMPPCTDVGCLQPALDRGQVIGRHRTERIGRHS